MRTIRKRKGSLLFISLTFVLSLHLKNVVIPNFKPLKRLIHRQNQTWNRRLGIFGKIQIKFLFSDNLNSRRRKK